MKRRRVRTYPPVTIDAPAIIAQAPYLRAVLRVMEVPFQDHDDIIQEVTAAAWNAVRLGRYTPDPDVPPTFALQRWLHGIIRRQVGHYRERAHRRREVYAIDVDVAVPALLHVPAPDGPYAAREMLAALARIPLEQRVAMVMHFLEGWTFAEIGDLLQINPATASTRTRRGVDQFIRAVVRWRRPGS